MEEEVVFLNSVIIVNSLRDFPSNVFWIYHILTACRYYRLFYS